MKVLTDWQDGNPPKAGVWLMRQKDSDFMHAMARWDGTQWWWPNGDRVGRAADIQWRGLAFDPSSAVRFYDDETYAPVWVIPEFSE